MINQDNSSGQRQIKRIQNKDKKLFHDYFSSIETVNQEASLNFSFTPIKNEEIIRFLFTQWVANQAHLDFSEKYESYHYASFKIPLYKMPFSSVATIFLPLSLLAGLNFGIFFQDENLANRIACIASLALAFVAFIPTIR